MKKAAKITFVLLIAVVIVCCAAIKLNENYSFVQLAEIATSEDEFIRINAENDDFKYLITQDGVTLIKYKGESETPEIPEKIEEHHVYKIKNSCFAGNEAIKSISLPKTLKYIDNFAFYNCKNLESVEFNDGLSVIGDSAFRKTALTNIEFPSTLFYIGSAAFMDCEELENAVFHNNTSLKIGMCAFRSTGIKQLSLPAGTYEIEKSAFTKCKHLTIINIPEESDASVKGIADYGVKIIRN